MSTTHETQAADRLDAMRVRLAALSAKIRRGALLTLLVGLIILGLLTGYFYYGYTQFSEITQPDRIAGSVQTLVDDNLPSMRKSIEDEITKQAPTLAERLSNQVRENIPTGREKLEDYIIAQMKTSLEQGAVLTSEQIATFLRNNRDALRRDAKELAKSPELAQASIGELEKALEAELGGSLKGQAMEMMTGLNATNDKLDKLSKSSNLNKTEQIERRLLQISRRLQMEQVGGGDAGAMAGRAMPISAGSALRGMSRKAAETSGAVTRAEPAATRTEAKPEAAKPAKPPTSQEPAKPSAPADNKAASKKS
jgi:hypothetical protein